MMLFAVHLDDISLKTAFEPEYFRYLKKTGVFCQSLYNIYPKNKDHSPTKM